MKTPKEEAVELFNAMKGFRIKHTHSKKCAKVAVRKILEVIGDSMFSEYEHYEKVLTELDKL